LGNALGQSEAVKFIQKTFEKIGAITGGFENRIRADFHLAVVPVMNKIFRPGGITPSEKLKISVHPIIDS
jgi:hypothetical protein